MSITKQKSIHGRKVYTSTRDHLVGRHGTAAGAPEGPHIVHGQAPGWAGFVEDFWGAIDDTGKPFPGGHMRAVVGDTGHTNAMQDATNGVFRLFSAISATAAKTAAAGVGVTAGQLQWKGNQGPGSDQGSLRFAARLKLGDVGRASNEMHVFAGLTDIASYEFPAYDTGAGVISAAADYMGFMFSPRGDTGWSAVAGKSTAGDSGDQVVALDTGVASGLYDEIEIEYNRGPGDTGGTAVFYVDGIPVGSIISPIAPGVALTPCIYAFSQDTGTNFVDIDYINVAAPRDTGA